MLGAEADRRAAERLGNDPYTGVPACPCSTSPLSAVPGPARLTMHRAAGPSSAHRSGLCPAAPRPPRRELWGSLGMGLASGPT